MLNKQLVDQLQTFLDNRESRAAKAVLEQLHFPASGISKFSDLVDLVAKRSRQSFEKPSESTKAKINKILWDYLETLEGCVTELFQQLDQVGVEEWSIELSHIVDAIQEMLLHRLDDLNWAIRRLNHVLKDFEKSSLKKKLLFWKTPLDRALKTNLEKCRKYLGFRYKRFADQYERYIDMHTAIELVVDKFSECQVFNKLDPETQEKFKKLYRLVKLWRLNISERALPRRDTVRAVRNAMSPERAQVIFKEYDKQLWRALFEKSDLVKELPSEVLHRGNVSRLQEQIDGYRLELKTLLSILKAYREFLLKSDPGTRAKPYLGFSEWSLGPESHETRRFSMIAEDLEHLDGVFQSFSEAIETKGTTPELTVEQADAEIQPVLHEMTQPLISRANMRSRSEELVGHLQKLDILANSDINVVEYVGDVLNKAMGADWQFQTLFDLPAFHQIYVLYQGLINPLNERAHQNRLQKFKRLIQQLSDWVKNKDTPRHMHEIELDLNDMKGYFQDFLAHAQRLSRDEGEDRAIRLDEISHELLEYRYMFGNFFHLLMDESVESRTLRKQLLFVDQYFEAVDTCLHQIRESLK